ncbi:MAG: ferritin family protein [Anaerolineae bacterium]
MTDTHDFSLEEAWQTAIQREKEAYEFYMRVYRSATDPAVKTLFRHLAQQETTHQRLLEDEFDRMFRPDM